MWKHDLSDNRVLIARGLCEENLLRSKEDLSIFMDISRMGRMGKRDSMFAWHTGALLGNPACLFDCKIRDQKIYLDIFFFFSVEFYYMMNETTIHSSHKCCLVLTRSGIQC